MTNSPQAKPGGCCFVGGSQIFSMSKASSKRAVSLYGFTRMLKFPCAGWVKFHIAGKTVSKKHVLLLHRSTPNELLPPSSKYSISPCLISMGMSDSLYSHLGLLWLPGIPKQGFMPRSCPECTELPSKSLQPTCIVLLYFAYSIRFF